MAFFSSNKIKIFVLSFFVLLGGMLFSPKDVDAACQVTDADFRSAVSYPTNYFTAPGNEPYVYIDISTTGCVGQAPIQLSISAATGLFVDGLYYDDLGNFDDIGITVAQDNFSIYTKATNEECASNYGGWDCHYRLEIEDGDGESIWEGAYDGTGDDAMLSFDCWGSIACTTWSDWVLVSTNNTYGSYAADDNFSNIPETNLPTINPSSEYLAPLPGLAGQTPDLGGFLKGLFQVLIVIAGLLAMIMLVMGAITYLSSDAFSGKSSGKEMMMSAVFGLILALGAWVIINTINPNLASTLSIKIPALQLDAPRKEWDNGNAAPGTNIAEGVNLNGQPITQGGGWPSDATQRGQLAAAGISVVASGDAAQSDGVADCTEGAGTPHCTSVYFEGEANGVIQQIINFKNTCGREVKITGGSEAWLHVSHGPDKKVVDMSATESLTTYLRSLPGGPPPGNTFPTGKSIGITGVGKFKAEGAGDNQNTTAQHWHVKFY